MEPLAGRVGRPDGSVAAGDRALRTGFPMPEEGLVTTRFSEDARGARGWSRADFEPGDALRRGDPSAFLDQVFALRPEAWLRRVAGRETFLWPGRSDYVVKRTTDASARDWWYERLQGSAPRSAGFREAGNLEQLARDGFAVARPLAWADERRARSLRPRSGGRSVVVMTTIEHEESLRDRLERAAPPEQRALAARLGDFVARLHAAGWYHRDLYVQHFVLERSAEAPERLVLLDVGRARKEAEVRQRWFVKDLAALLHSVPDRVTRTERLRFLHGWLAGQRGAGQDRRRWVRAITRKERRMASHAPRRVDLRSGPQSP